MPCTITSLFHHKILLFGCRYHAVDIGNLCAEDGSTWLRDHKIYELLVQVTIRFHQRPVIWDNKTSYALNKTNFKPLKKRGVEEGDPLSFHTHHLIEIQNHEDLLR
ncbi:hypothetical protein TNCV_2190151 [Trichonephila clavipes]|uniref:Uncharacterized protein n=1 Tax=Trichonephila clavipes TaxID=2585209 RepID=A0A8X6UXZ1_TRICX|nr:hypothetical protein TNCV_2190151 [Trichonephila clavipes]